MNRAELIAAIEAAEGPSRELDAEFHKISVGLRMYESIVSDGDDLVLRYYPGPPGPDYDRLPHYTKTLAGRSICAAILKAGEVGDE